MYCTGFFLFCSMKKFYYCQAKTYSYQKGLYVCCVQRSMKIGEKKEWSFFYTDYYFTEMF